MAEIAFDGVSKRFGSVEAVRELSLLIGDGEFLVLLGPSGCGKTTALRMLSGLETLTTGHVYLDGRDITSLSPGDRDLAMVFQSYALYPHMSVVDNMRFGLRMRKIPRPEIERRVQLAAGMLQIEELLHRRPRELSGGQRQRVALGRAIVREPRAFLMDEPLSNLDAKLRAGTRVELAKLHRTLETTVVYVTHDQVEAMTLATRIAVMAEGRLQQVGTPEEVYDRPATTFVAEFMGTPPMNLFPAEFAVRDQTAEARADAIYVPLGGGVAAGTRDVWVGVRPEDLRYRSDHQNGHTPRIDAQVQATEMLGNELVVLAQVGEHTCAMRSPRGHAPAPGELLRLTCDPDRVHLFDRGSGRRLVRTPLPAGDSTGRNS